MACAVHLAVDDPKLPDVGYVEQIEWYRIECVGIMEDPKTVAQAFTVTRSFRTFRPEAVSLEAVISLIVNPKGRRRSGNPPMMFRSQPCDHENYCR